MRAHWVFNFVYSLFLTMMQTVFFLATALKIKGLGFDEFASGQAGTAFGVTFMVTAWLAGRLTDRIGRCAVMRLSFVFAIVPCLFMTWAASFAAVLVWVVCFSASNGGIWPAYEASIADRASGPLSREMMAFNLGWSSGAAIGFLFTGFVNQYGFQLSFLACGGIAVVLALVCLFMRDAPQTPERTEADVASRTEEADPSKSAGERIRASGRLRSVWVANFGMWFSWSIILWVFPVQAKNLGMSDDSVGTLMSILPWTEVGVFLVLLLFTTWYLSLSLRVTFQLIAAGGFVLFALDGSSTVFAMGMVAFGIGLATAYSASLIVSVRDEQFRGSRSGIHETLVGAATVLGPLAAGFASARLGHWAAYVISIGVVALALAVQAVIAWSVQRQLAMISGQEEEEEP